MTDLEKIIYNKHLAISRSSRNKPFSLRSNFEQLENEPKVTIPLKRLSIFFTKHNDVNFDTYFIAPYALYPDVQYFDLSYFASPRGIKSYTIYKQQLLKTSPDEQINDVKESLIFISRFCIENNIQLPRYITFTKSKIEPEWFYHYKTNKINLYSLMEFENLSIIINKLPIDEKELLLGDFGVNFFTYKNKYNNSKELKTYLQKAFLKIKLFVDKNLNSSKTEPQ